MKDPVEYQVLGGDGQEYGPVAAKQIRAWIADGRLEPKSPVKPTGARDWIFLESLPEFARALQSQKPPPVSARRKWPLAILLFLLAGFLIVALKKFYHP